LATSAPAALFASLAFKPDDSIILIPSATISV